MHLYTYEKSLIGVALQWGEVAPLDSEGYHIEMLVIGMGYLFLELLAMCPTDPINIVTVVIALLSPPDLDYRILWLKK